MKNVDYETIGCTSERFLRYPGSKGRREILDIIRSFLPEDFTEYREPFCGSASVALSLPTWISRWINDVNPHLIALFQALKERPNDLIEQCVAVPPAKPYEPVYLSARGIAYPIRLKDKYDELLDNPNADPAFRYLFLNRMGHSGRVFLDPGQRNQNVFTNPKGWSWDFLAKLDRAVDLLAGMKITCGGFSDVFTAPGDDVFIYVDAPYLCDTRSPQKLYQFGFTEAQHVQLRNVVGDCGHRVMLSYDDDPYIRSLYQGFRIHPVAWTYMSRGDKRVGRELIITNYPIAK